MASREIDQRRHKFWLPVKFLKVYAQKNKEIKKSSILSQIVTHLQNLEFYYQ